MRSFRIIVKSPYHLVGYDDQVSGRTGWIEHMGDQWLIVINDHQVRKDYRRPSLEEAIQLFALKLSGING